MQEESLPPAQLMESRRIAACMLNYCGRHPDAVAPLFDLLSIFTVGRTMCKHGAILLIGQSVNGAAQLCALHACSCPSMLHGH